MGPTTDTVSGPNPLICREVIESEVRPAGMQLKRNDDEDKSCCLYSYKVFMEKKKQYSNFFLEKKSVLSQIMFGLSFNLLPVI